MSLRNAFKVLFAQVLINRWFFSSEANRYENDADTGIPVRPSRHHLKKADYTFKCEWWRAQQEAWTEEGRSQALSPFPLRREGPNCVQAPTENHYKVAIIDRPLGDHSLEMAWGDFDHAYWKKGTKWRVRTKRVRFGPKVESIGWFL